MMLWAITFLLLSLPRLPWTEQWRHSQGTGVSPKGFTLNLVMCCISLCLEFLSAFCAISSANVLVTVSSEVEFFDGFMCRLKRTTRSHTCLFSLVSQVLHESPSPQFSPDFHHSRQNEHCVISICPSRCVRVFLWGKKSKSPSSSTFNNPTFLT